MRNHGFTWLYHNVNLGLFNFNFIQVLDMLCGGSGNPFKTQLGAHENRGLEESPKQIVRKVYTIPLPSCTGKKLGS